jgi:hypothetical protein
MKWHRELSMNPFAKIVLYVSLSLLALACSIQTFRSYHNWKATQWCNHFGAYYNELGGPPKNWEWPWNWSMLTYVSVSRDSHKSNYRFNSISKAPPEPSIEDIRELFSHIQHLPKLRFVGVYLPRPFEVSDLIGLGRRDQIVVYSSSKFTNEEMKFIQDKLPGTIVSIHVMK